MVSLNSIVQQLDKEFQVENFGPDLSFSRFIPYVYRSISFDYESYFEKRFNQLFNGLMLRGAEKVGKIFLAVFPTDQVLNQFLEISDPGDLLFMHHPLLMECGDPQGKWGKGFVPINEKYLKKIKEKKVSVYTCHIPLDSHKELGTNVAIAKQLNAEILENVPSNDEFILYAHIKEIDTNKLISSLLDIFQIPYVDFEGKHHKQIRKIAIVAGCGDVVDWMKEAEKNGAQAYITGEVHCHIDNSYGRQKFNLMMDYVAQTSMSLIGVSHSASEYLVHKTLLKDWFETNFDVQTVLIPQEKWWL